MMRAKSSGVSLSNGDAAIVKGMLVRGDRQHDIAAWFGVNGGRIGEIATGYSYADIIPAAQTELPPRGPYTTGRDAAVALAALDAARQAIINAQQLLSKSISP
jgi:hypothetical protein